MAEPTAEEKAATEKEAAEKVENEKIEKENKKVLKAAAEKEAAEKVAAAAKQESGKSAIEEAKDVLEKITEQNKITTENLKKQEELQAEMMISGKAPAGQGSLSEEERKDADARKLIEGSGFEDRIFPQNKK